MAVILATSRLTFCTSSSVSCCSSSALACSPSTTSSMAALRRPGRAASALAALTIMEGASPVISSPPPGSSCAGSGRRRPASCLIFSRRCLASTSAVLVIGGRQLQGVQRLGVQSSSAAPRARPAWPRSAASSVEPGAAGHCRCAALGGRAEPLGAADLHGGRLLPAAQQPRRQDHDQSQRRAAGDHQRLAVQPKGKAGGAGLAGPGGRLRAARSAAWFRTAAFRRSFGRRAPR